MIVFLKKVSIFLNLALDKLIEAITLDSEDNWIMKNNNKVLEVLNNWSDNNEISNNLKVVTFDFSTLFTTIPHDDLIRCIVALLNKYFASDIVIHFDNEKLFSLNQNLLKF